MVEVAAKQVVELRKLTGARVNRCKEALEASGGDIEHAQEWLRKKGESDAGKKSDRDTAEGCIHSYIHGGRIGVMVEVRCETDFVARNEEFQHFLKDICMHIAAAAPRYLSREDFPKEEAEKEREIFRTQVSGKPANIVEKIVEGKLTKVYEASCLLEQPFVKDDKMLVGDLVKQKIAKVGENIRITRFVRWELGG